MRACFNRFLGDGRGAAAVELAFALPVLLMLSVGMTEVGRAFFEAAALEKALRAGALFAAQQPLPLSDSARTAAENIIRTGSPDGDGPLLLAGMAAQSASISVATHDYYLGGGQSVPVIRATASVPFDPILPGLDTVFGPGGYVFSLSHEQGYIGG